MSGIRPHKSRPIARASLEALKPMVAKITVTVLASQLRTSPLTLAAVLSGAPVKEETAVRIERAIDSYLAGQNSATVLG